MSFPANRLAQYRSYSYYHVLCLCDTTATADAITAADEQSVRGNSVNIENVIDRYLHKEDDRYGAKSISIDPQITGGIGSGTGKYVVLINGSTDADFVISTLRWTAMTAASIVNDDRFASMAQEGTMEITEPRGVIFLNRIAEACTNVGISAESAIFLLKTFIIGHKYDEINGVDVIDYVSDITPLKFMMLDIVSEFTITGSVYSLEFMSTYNGATRLPQFRGIDGLKLTFGGTVESAIKALEAKVRERYETYQKCIFAAYDTYVRQLQEQARQNQLTDSSGKPLEFLKAEDAFAVIEYKLELDPLYKNALYKIDDNAAQYSNHAACDSKDNNMQIPIGASLEQAVDLIMMRSKQIKKDGQGDNAEKQKRRYVIHTKLESVPVGVNDQGTSKLKYVLTYKVAPQIQVKNQTLEGIFKQREGTQTSATVDPTLAAQITNNLIEFDYIYSGKNIDILDFSMKQQMAHAFLMAHTVGNSLKDQSERAGVRSPAMTPQTAGSDVAKARNLVQPLYYGTHIRNPGVINSQTTYDAAAFHSAFTKWASVEALEAKIRITGNVQLLSSVARDTTKTRATTSDPEVVAYHWGEFPALAKVNVYMPTSNDDIAIFQSQDSYTMKFWYDSYYYIVSVDNIFQDGTFEQELEMISLPYKLVDDDDPKAQAQRAAQKSFDETLRKCTEIPQKDVNCEDVAKDATNRTAGAPTTPSTPGVAQAPQTPIGVQTAPTETPNAQAPGVTVINQLKEGLKVKGGLNGQAFQGGETHPGTLSLAQQIQREVRGFQIFTGFNDEFHKAKYPGSKHAVGRALDYTVVNRQYARDAVTTTEQIMRRAGLNAGEYNILDEYTHPSPHATGGHIHVSFSSAAAANKFLGTTGTGAPTPGTTATPPAEPQQVSPNPEQQKTVITPAKVLGEKRKNCGDDQTTKKVEETNCERDKATEPKPESVQIEEIQQGTSSNPFAVGA